MAAEAPLAASIGQVEPCAIAVLLIAGLRRAHPRSAAEWQERHLAS